MSRSQTLQDPVGIIGAGVAGLINAHVLLQDGFKDVTLITRDKSVGGTWARTRVYPGLHINNVHGEYRFSALEMPPPDSAAERGDRLSGLEMCNYMERFTEEFLIGKAKFHLETEVLNIERDGNGKWNVAVEDLPTKSLRTLTFSRIILATGGCSNPKIPAELSQPAAEKAQFRGIVLHSSQFAAHLDKILDTVKPIRSPDDSETILVVGGGKSAQDMATKLTLEGRKVAIVFETTDVFIASTSPTPAFIRKGRFLSAFTPYYKLNTRLERFLHTTTVGSAITNFFWKSMTETSFNAFKIPQGSPLRRSHSLYWGVRVSDEGCACPTNFHSLAISGKIDVIAPARVVGYADDGKSVVLSNGRIFATKCVLLGTGYQSSWSKIFKKEVAEEIGIDRHAPQTKVQVKWDYKTLENAPALRPENEKWVTSVYRGIVPAKNIEKRDFAIAGAMFSANPGYSFEVAAHWISSYFQNDKMRLPSSADEAMAQAEIQSAWMKSRYPNMAAWANESYSGSLDFWTWPQAADELLEDMYLPIHRSGGSWYNWIFKVIDLKEIATLGEERQAIRNESL
ncbi:FAD/NAD(P)-binding domain-containing protein [Phlegmacium glaucopus]|nr:FAD/NAD(P)-binding domain-containing protein [Phlegmacium glaucopus]